MKAPEPAQQGRARSPEEEFRALLEKDGELQIEPTGAPRCVQEVDLQIRKLLIVRCTTGSARIDMRYDGRHERFNIFPGRIGVMLPGQSARGRVTVDDSIRSNAVIASPEWIYRMSGGELDLSRLHMDFSKAIDNPLLREAIRTLTAATARDQMFWDTYSEHLAIAAVCELIAQYGEQRGPLRPQRVAAHRLERVVEYIEANLGSSLYLADLAAVANLSRVHFVREFRRFTGLAPHAFIVKRRIERATRLVAASDVTLKDVALQTGFCSQSHFTAAFRRVTGTTPASFRSSSYRARIE